MKIPWCSFWTGSLVVTDSFIWDPTQCTVVVLAVLQKLHGARSDVRAVKEGKKERLFFRGLEIPLGKPAQVLESICRVSPDGI